jgi:hypothetical protein
MYRDRRHVPPGVSGELVRFRTGCHGCDARVAAGRAACSCPAIRVPLHPGEPHHHCGSGSHELARLRSRPSDSGSAVAGRSLGCLRKLTARVPDVMSDASMRASTWIAVFLIVLWTPSAVVSRLALVGFHASAHSAVMLADGRLVLHHDDDRDHHDDDRDSGPDIHPHAHRFADCLMLNSELPIQGSEHHIVSLAEDHVVFSSRAGGGADRAPTLLMNASMSVRVLASIASAACGHPPPIPESPFSRDRSSILRI